MSQTRILTNGAFQVTLFGAPGYTYILEATDQVSSGAWASVATNVAGPTRVWTFVDPATPDLQRRFYRARLSD